MNWKCDKCGSSNIKDNSGYYDSMHELYCIDCGNSEEKPKKPNINTQRTSYKRCEKKEIYEKFNKKQKMLKLWRNRRKN